MHVAIILMLQSCAVPADTPPASTPPASTLPSNVHRADDGTWLPNDGFAWANPNDRQDLTVVAKDSASIPQITGSTEPSIIIGPTTTVSSSMPQGEYQQARAEYDEALSAYETAKHELDAARNAAAVTGSVINDVIRPQGLFGTTANLVFGGAHVDQISKKTTNCEVAMQRLDRAKTRLYNLETR